MKPAHNNTTRQAFLAAPASMLITDDAAFAENEKEKAEMDLFAFVPPRQVNDPLQWDESWFANYE